MSLPKVLVVEDEKSHRLVISKALNSSCDLDLAVSFSEAISKIGKNDYDLFILDIVLGDGEGFNLCQHIRSIEQYSHAPIIFLSAKSEVSTKVFGFELGADDYIVKPCDPAELRARVHAKIRSSKKTGFNSNIIRQGPICLYLDKQGMEIEGRKGKKRFVLTPLEFKLMYHLILHPEKMMSRENILDAVWGSRAAVLDRSVDACVAGLRRKLGEYKSFLRSIHGVGYQFTLEEVKQKRKAS